MDDTIRAIWYISLTETSDWLMGLSEMEDSFCISYRFRYYNSDDPFDKDDKKNWYKAKAKKSKTTLTETLQGCSLAFSELKTIAETTGYELIRGAGSLDDFMDEFKTLPFVHMSDPMSKEEFEKYQETGDLINT